MSDLGISAGMILFVDDEEDFRSSQAELLRMDYGYYVDEAGNAEEALQLARSVNRYQVALIDQVLQGSMNGIDLMRALRAEQPQVDVILLTGYGKEPETGALQAGAYRFLEKPVQVEVLHQMLVLCIDAQQARSDRDTARREHALLQTLLDLSQQVGGSLRQEEILQAAYEHLGRLMNVENLDIAIYNRRSGMLDFVFGYNEGLREASHSHLLALSDDQPGMTDWVIRHRAPLLITDRKAEPLPVPGNQWGAGDETNAWLGVPLLVQERAIGAIILQHPKAGSYDSTDQRILMAVANLVAQALVKAQLYAEIETLNRITRRIAGIQRLQELLDAIAEEVASLIDTRNLRIGLYREVRKEVDLLVRYQEGAKLDPWTLSIEEGLVGYTIRSGEPIRLCTAGERLDFIEQRQIKPVGQPCRSWLSAPLIIDEKRVIGAIAVQDYQRDGAYDEHDLDLLNRLANHLAVAIYKAQLWERLQRSLNQREMLYKITTFLSAGPSTRPEWIWWAFLHGVTAGHGLGFNRAMIFSWQADPANPDAGLLSGWRGIGDLDRNAAGNTWDRMKHTGIDSLDAFLKLSISDFDHTPVQQVLKDVTIQVHSGSEDIFSRAVFRQEASVADGRVLFPAAQAFSAAFDPIEYAVVPLRLGEQLHGVLVVDNNFNHVPIDEESLKLLRSFTEVFLTALHNLELSRNLEQQIKTVRSHYQVVTALRALPNKDESLDLIVHSLQELYDLDTCTFGLVNPIQKTIQFDLRHQLGIDRTVQIALDCLPVDVWEHLNNSDSPFVIRELDERPDVCALLVRKDLHSMVFLAVKDMDGALRAILTMGRCAGLTVKPEDYSSLHALAGQAGLAIQNAELFERLDLQLRAQKLLLAIGQRISGAVAEADRNVLQVIADSAQELTGADCVVVYPYFKEGRRYDKQNIASNGLWYKKKPEEFTDKERTRRSMTDIVLRNELLIVDKVSSGSDRHGKLKITAPAGFLQREAIQSFIGIRLETQAEWVGALFVNFRSEHYFTEDEILAIQAFATQAAIAIDKNRLVDRVQSLYASQLLALRGLRRAEQKVSNPDRDQDEVWQIILQAAVDVSGADRGWFLVKDENSTELTLGAKVKIPPASLAAFAQIRQGKQGITGWVAEHCRSVRVGDVKKDRLWANRYLPHVASTASEMVVPILIGPRRELVGVIDLESDRKYAFSRDMQKLVESLASTAAVAHQNAGLYHQVEQRQKYLSALLKASNAINASLDRQEILDLILEQAVRLTEIEGTPPHFGTIMLKEGATLVFTNVYPGDDYRYLIGKIGERISLLEGVVSPSGEWRIGVTGRVALTQAPKIVSDVRSDPDYLPFSQYTLSELVVPLLRAGEVVGVLNIEHKRADAFNQADVDALQILAQQAVIAIKNAETYMQLARQQRELEEKQDELAASSAVAWTGILGSTLAHDIQGDARALSNSAGYVAQKLGPAVSDVAVQKQLSVIQNISQRILDQSMYFKLSPEELPDRLEINQLLADRVEVWKSRYESDAMEWEVYFDPNLAGSWVRVNRIALEKAMRNVVDNGIKFQRGRPARKIILRTQQVGDQVRIDFQDFGPGIPEGVRQRLFKGPRVHGPDQSGQGFGLLISWLVLRAMNGSIQLANTGPAGTTFSLYLPLEPSHEE